MKKIEALLGLVVSGSLALSHPATAQSLVNAAFQASLSGSGEALSPEFSSDGRYVFFLSTSRNLVTNDTLARSQNLYRFDVMSRATALVSASSTGIGGANDHVAFPSMSSDGRFAAFVSAANNLVANDSNSASDVFMRDLVTGSTTLVSADLTGVAPSNSVFGQNLPLSTNPQISATGRWTFFESSALMLVPEADANGQSDVFARETQSNRTVLVSISSQGTQTANGISQLNAITPDGRFVVFTSTATDLVPNGPTDQLRELYVRDMEQGTTVWASPNIRVLLGDPSALYFCVNPVITPDGHYLVFKAGVTNSTNAVVVFRDLQSSTNRLLASHARLDSFPQITSDGNRVSFEDSGNIYVWNRQTNAKTLVSVNIGGSNGGSGMSHSPAMSADGQRIAFVSDAPDLVPGATRRVFNIYIRDLAAGTTRLVTRNGYGEQSGSDHELKSFVISPDGSLVAFESADDSLVVGDLNRQTDIFLRNLTTEQTILVSAASRASRTATASSGVAAYSVSDNGNRIVFMSKDGNLVQNDTNRWNDVFVRDLQQGRTIPVSTDNGIFSPTNEASLPVISANGRYVSLALLAPPSENCVYISQWQPARFDLETGTIDIIFTTSFVQNSLWSPLPTATSISSDGNLVAFEGVSNSGGPRIMLRDMTTGSNQVVSLNENGNDLFSSHFPLLSPDATAIVFLQNNNILYLRELQQNQSRVITSTAKAPTVGHPLSAVFSANSRFLAYSASGGVYVYDRQTQSNTVVCSQCDSPSISGDCRLVAYRTRVSASLSHIEVTDRTTGTRRLLSKSISGNGGGNAESYSPMISRDGRFVVFASKASDLVLGDANGWADIFVADLVQNKTYRITGEFSGLPFSAGPASSPIMGPDGRTVVFQSFAADLIADDFNNTRDLFVLKLGAGDSDNDGLPDDWEMAYFNTLDRDGKGDFDGDGYSDLDEYRAGTDPTNIGSVFRVLTLTSMNGGGTQIIWSAVAGATYRVEYKADLNSSWAAFPGLVTASSATGSMTDTDSGASPNRFYRVVLVD